MRARWGVALSALAVACGGSVETRSGHDAGAAGHGASDSGGTADSDGTAGSGGVAGGATCGIPDDPCGLPPDPGHCTAAFKAYHFNPASAQCESFIYGGCEGNANRFNTPEECQQACAHRADQCYVCDAAGTCADHDCAACPGTAYCSGEPCDVPGLACVFLPSCGATTCTCKAGPNGTTVWECIPNTC